MSIEAVAGLVLAGVAVGALSALMGVGGGVLMVPLLLFLGESQHVAEGTSLAVIVPTALAGVIAHRRRGYARLRDGLVVGAGGIPGAWLGARVALAIEADVLQRAFALFLLWVGIRLSYRSFQSLRASRQGQDNAS